jgi:hypothetical protein
MQKTRKKESCRSVIKVGPAGSGGLGNLKGIQKVARMKLDCMEVEFTYGVRTTLAAARELGSLAQALLLSKTDVTLICESPEPYKDAAMMKRMINRLESFEG